MLPNCNAPALCTFDSSIHGIILLKKFPCTPYRGYTYYDNPVFEIANLCPTRAYYYNPYYHCISPHTTQAGAGRFGTIHEIGVDSVRINC
jgi:hypothetical protein